MATANIPKKAKLNKKYKIMYEDGFYTAIVKKFGSKLKDYNFKIKNVEKNI